MGQKGKGLSPKQQAFCEEYLKDLNMTQAAIRAGYSQATAGQQGEQLLKKLEIHDTIAALKKKRSEETGIDAAWVLKRLALRAQANLQTVASWTDSGLHLKASDSLTEEETYTIKKIRVKETVNKDGERIVERSIDLIDADKALDLLAKHVGIVKQDGVTINNLLPPVDPKDITPDTAMDNIKRITLD